MNLLITGAWNQAEDYLQLINKRHNVLFVQYENDALPCSPEWVEGIIGNSIFITHDILSFKNLHYIQLTSAGFDRVPMNYVKEKRISIYNARGVYSIPMSEYAISGVLSIYKRNIFFANNQKEHKWVKDRNLRELYGKNVCICGCGSVGTECAKRFSAMGCIVFGVDTIVKDGDEYNCIFKTDQLQQVLPKADIVIITLPLSDQTKHLFDKKILSCLKNGAVLVNISRGAVVETGALKNELKSGRISAVLDVFEKEPLDDGELWDLENVIITPHNSFVGEGNGKRLSELILRNLQDYEENAK